MDFNRFSCMRNFYLFCFLLSFSFCLSMSKCESAHDIFFNKTSITTAISLLQFGYSNHRSCDARFRNSKLCSSMKHFNRLICCHRFLLLFLSLSLSCLSSRINPFLQILSYDPLET